MATYQFLSDEWLAEARSIRAEFDGKGATIDHSIRMNLVIGAVPFGEGSVTPMWTPPRASWSSTPATSIRWT